MKKVIFLCLVFLIIFLIYICNMDKKVYYLSLGDNYGYSDVVENHLKRNNVFERKVQFGEDGYYIYEVINDIKDNSEKSSITLQHALIKADLVTLSVHINNNREKAYDYIDEYAFDLDKLLKLMRQYCKEDIIFVSYYDLPSDILSYLDEKFSKVCAKYDVFYVSNISKIPLVINKTVLKG